MSISFSEVTKLNVSFNFSKNNSESFAIRSSAGEIDSRKLQRTGIFPFL